MSFKGRYLQALSDLACTGAVTKNRIIGYDGNMAGAGAACLGIAEENFNIGERVDVRHIGTAIVEVGTGGLTAGDAVASDSVGKGVRATGTNGYVGFALVSGSAGEFVEVQLKQGTLATSALASGSSVILHHGEGTMNGTSNVDVTVSGGTASSKYIVSHNITPTGPITITPGTGKFTIVSADAGDTGTFEWIQTA